MGGTGWTITEDNTLREIWPTATREELYNAFPSRTWSAIRHNAQRLGVRRINRSGWIDGTLNERELQVLIGGLLGDGCLRICGKRGVNARYAEDKKKSDIKYLLWKAKELSRFAPNVKEYEEKSHLWTGSHPELTSFYHRWYPNGYGTKKLVLADIKKLNPLGLAVWAQDEGYLEPSLRFNFASERFGWEGNKILQQVLKENFKLGTKIYPLKLKHELSCRTCLTRQVEVRKLSKIIEPFVILPCMGRKIICAATLKKHDKWVQRRREKARIVRERSRLECK